MSRITSITSPGTLFLRAVATLALVLATTQAVQPDSPRGASPAKGPLRVHITNPCYFTDGTTTSDGSLKAVYLTGSHHWNNLQDSAKLGQPLTDRFDYDAYLGFLTNHNHNFMRMWGWEVGENDLYYEPAPWIRPGPGTAADGKPKFDLTRFNPEYFERLRSRVIAAREQGIYVSVMLFQGWSIYSHGYGNPWPIHPFNKANNLNGIDGDADHDGEGKEVHALQVPAVTRVQEAYACKIIDTLNDLDNVLYEISNETAIFSKDWQYHIIRFIKQYEATKPKQHPVGITAFDSGREGSMAALLGSPADWISPQNDGAPGDYQNDPPAADGRKVILGDTDHLWGVGGDRVWVWKSFTRGHNPIYMDPLRKDQYFSASEAQMESARKAMGHTRRFSERMELAVMMPQPKLASTRYCLASAGKEYLIYQPRSREAFSVELLPGEYHYEWFDPAKGEEVEGGNIQANGSAQQFKGPFAGDAVLYLRRAGLKAQRRQDVKPGAIHFFVDPATNSDDPEQRRAYGLRVVPPWPDGGWLFVNLPEHLEYMPGTRGIARHHDKRQNVWQVSTDGTEARYAVESLSEPGVFFAAQARIERDSVRLEMSITNRSAKTLKSIRPLFCFQYHDLHGFPHPNSDNFAHTFVVTGGKPVAVADLLVKRPEAYARMAQVRECTDQHNWWAEEMGGFIEQPLDLALTVLTAANDDRKVVLAWKPGKNLLTNAAIPCFHADPCFGDLAPGEARTVNGELLFTRAPLLQVVSQAAVK